MTRLEGVLRAWRGAESSPPPQVPAQPQRALPAVLQPWRPVRAALPKPTAANLRRMAEQPVVRRAINLVKDRVANMEWQVRLKRDAVPSAEHAERIWVLRRMLEAPNPQDSFRTFAEQVLEDVVVGGFGAVEIERVAPDARPSSLQISHTIRKDVVAPLRLWPVDGATIQVDGGWTGDADVPRYAQHANVLGGTSGMAIGTPQPLLDGELMYVRLNPRTHTPLGLGRVEVAFDTVNQFLSAHRYAGRLASNSVVQYALWLDEATPAQHERLIRWWQDEVEGTGQVPILSTDRKPEVLRFGQGTDEDLRLRWQEFLLRVIANAFDLPPMFLGLQGDVNRSTAAELSAQSFESAVLPVASLFAEHITRDVLDKALGWSEYEFVFADQARDEATQTALQLQLLQAGVLTVDEVRAQRGLGPLERSLEPLERSLAPMAHVKEQQQTEEDDAAARNGGEVS